MIERERLTALIDYVEASESDRLRIVSDMADYGRFRAGAECAGLPGVSVNEAGDDPVWLRVDRLARTRPPPSGDPGLRLWMDLSDDADTAPVLRLELPRARLPDAERETAPHATVRLADYAGKDALAAALAAYRREIWSPWADEERPRRRAIALYNGLFALRQSLDGGADEPVELVWGIGIARWQRPLGRLVHPLLTVPVELTLDDGSHAMLIRPRSEAAPAIEAAPLDALEVEAVDEWRAWGRRHLDMLEGGGDGGVSEGGVSEGGGVSPFVAESFGPVLRRAVAVLDPGGHYLPDLPGRSLPPGDDGLRVDGEWVILERRRQATQLMDDLHRFKAEIAGIGDAEGIPAAVRVLLQPPATQVKAETVPTYRGVSTIPGVTTSDGSGEDLFFPLPFNREQVEVVQRLANRPGVVVMGPPGTGKTHTIANIISHYLANGKRVLVTSQKAPALKVLRDKLPASVRPLAVALLESDRDGLKQFQESVDIIADTLHRTRPGEVRQRIAALDGEIEGLHRGLAAIDRQVEEIGRLAMTQVTIDGRPVSPGEAARRVVAAHDLADWLPDAIDAVPEHEPRFDDDTIVRLRQARRAVGDKLALIDTPMPPADLPDAATVAALHRDLREADTLAQATRPEEALAGGTSIEAAAALRERIERLPALLADGMRGGQDQRTDAILARLREDADDPALAAVAGLAGEVDRLSEEARHFLVRPIVLPADAADDPSFRDAIARLAIGEAPGLWSRLRTPRLKDQLAAVRLTGTAPADADGWAEVARHMAAMDDTGRLVAAWNHAAGEAGLDQETGVGLAPARAMRRQLDRLAWLRALVQEERDLGVSATAMVPAWHRPIHVAGPAASDLVALLDRHMRMARLSAARTASAALRARLAPVSGAIGDDLRAIAGSMVGAAGYDAALVERRWAVALAEAAALQGLAATFSDIRGLAGAIADNGAPEWAERLLREAVTGSEDPLTPGDWRERWTLRRLATWLLRIDRHDALRTLAGERSEHEAQLRRAYEQAIELRTWCRLAERASDQVRAALAAYAQAMRKLGKGTGKRAGRYRTDARQAANRAKNALPCWIMPHYRVSASLPAELGLFDLVVVDEASQSTLAALPALLRAKQMLIVGDDRQVSPDAGFREEQRMNVLADRHLSGQEPDYRSAMREEQSLFDLGSVVFAGGTIMLKEHFRCVAPVIEYSKGQFYSHQLVPLRLPSASERLDPPLIDILVEDGYRKGKINPPEVDCIVDGIGRIVDDPALKGRSIGVTTLLGHEQARAITTAIEQVIGAETMLRHNIRVGEPAAFQGDERDIMFISLVAAARSSAMVGKMYDQRFNVAASRARDRMILVRSVDLQDLSPADTLRRGLIEHFNAPFAGDGQLASDRRPRCESPFEEAMYDRLVERGYRVDTQVPVGTKRIDMVVEGGDDRRLAIECDGDRYHGPEQWPDDMARQRMLERAGWAVWRCFASRFMRQGEAVMEELVGVLAARGIVPEVGAARPPSRHTEHRRWRSQLDAAEPVPHAWLVPAEPFQAKCETSR